MSECMLFKLWEFWSMLVGLEFIFYKQWSRKINSLGITFIRHSHYLSFSVQFRRILIWCLETAYTVHCNSLFATNMDFVNKRSVLYACLCIFLNYNMILIAFFHTFKKKRHVCSSLGCNTSSDGLVEYNTYESSRLEDAPSSTHAIDNRGRLYYTRVMDDWCNDWIFPML